MELFSRQGFDGTTVEEIAEACEVSPRTFFRYFPTKEDVLFGDSGERSAALVETLAAQPLDLTPLAAIHAAMRLLACTYNEQRDVLVARAAIVQGSPGLRAYKVEHQRGWDEALVAGLERRNRAMHTPSATTASPPTISGCSRRCRWPRSAPRSRPGSSSPTSPTSWSWSTTRSSRCRAAWRCSAVSRRRRGAR